MTQNLAPARLLCLLAFVLALAACEDSEDRATRHLENAEALVAQDDLGAAVLEFRNVLQYVPAHREALTQLAAIQEENGAEDAAFGTYQRLVDNHPEATEGWLSLAEIAIRSNRWEEAATFAEQAAAQAPDSARTALIGAALDFRTAVQAEDAATAGAAADVARAHVADDPDSLIARQILIAHAGTFLSPEDALAEIDAALAVQPGIYALHQIKVQTLAELGATAAVGPALEAMADQFPDQTEPRQLLVAWYMQQGEPDEVERFLRAEATGADVEFSDRLNLVNFLRETQGPEATLAEIDGQLEAMRAAAGADEGTDRDLAILRGLRATLQFDLGEPETALAELDEVLAGLPEGAEANNLRVARARILMALGRDDAAAAEIETVLAQDSGQVEAIKIKAARLIAADETDETDEAVRLLRQAQATAPRDAEVVLMMGEAHARAGNWDLARERYSAAVDLSQNAPRETLAYAGFLMGRGEADLAEPVLLDALRQAPRDAALIRMLTEIYLQGDRIGEARRGIAELRGLGTADARQLADAFEAEALRRENRIEEMATLVEGMAAEGRGNAESLAALVQAQIAAGRTDEAAALLERQLETYPGDPLLRFLQAGLLLTQDEPDRAEPIYRELLAESPGAAAPLRVLHGLLMMQGRTDEAQALLEETRAAAPQALLPRLMLAEQAERSGDAETAIDLYEGIYAQDNSNLVVANNLANLLMLNEDDPAAIERATAITRRLRDTQEPAFQDTYGWLAYLRGEYDTALEYLEPAADALPQEPVVQFHLGMTYLALEQVDAARTALERTLELAGDRPLPQAARAREALEGL